MDQSPKTTPPGSTSPQEPVERVDTSPAAPATKTSPSIEQIVKPVATTPVGQKSSPASVKSEEKQKPAESIPKFYFPNGQNTPSTNETELSKQLRQVKEELFLPKQDKLHLEDFGKLAQVQRRSSLFHSI